MPYEEDVAGYFDRARKEARKTKDKKDEAKVIKKDEDDGCIPDVGEEIDLDEWIDHSDVSDEEETQTRQTRKRGRKYAVKKNCKGETQLHAACSHGNTALVMLLLFDLKHPVNVRDYSGWLPIHVACNHGYVAIARLLISKDAAINDRGGKACKGMTPLHYACSNGHLEVVELLLEKGASPIALTHGGKTPLDYLKVWREEQDLDPIMQTYYETLVAKMTTALEMVGRSTTQTISNTPADSDALYFEKPTGTPARSPRGTPAKSPRVSPKKASPYRPVGSLRYSVDVGDDLDKPYAKKIKTFVNLDVSQHDSEPNPISQAIPNPIIPILTVNVRVENKLWRIPVPANEINELSIEWLAKEASKWYYKQEGISPTLQLMTKEGALLLNEDPLRMIFTTTAQADEIHSSIVNWNLPPLPERYLELCNIYKIAPCSRVRKCLDESQGTLSLKLANLSLNKYQFPLIFRALNRQNNLIHLEVSNINLLNEEVQYLSFALPYLVQLRSLNLSRNKLTGAGIRSLSEIFINAEQPILTNLTDFNLSYNIFGDDTIRHLAAIFQKLKLRHLDLSGCCLPKNIFDSVFNQGLSLNLVHLETFDLSVNDLSTEDIIKFLSFLNFDNITNLNLANNSNVSKSGITKAIADKLSLREKDNIKNLNLSRCYVNDAELWDLLRALKYSQERDELRLTFNRDLTGVSLRRLLQHRPSFSSLNLLGCTNILQYFDINTFTNNPMNGVIHINTLKKFKISLNVEKNSKEADALLNMWLNIFASRSRIIIKKRCRGERYLDFQLKK